MEKTIADKLIFQYMDKIFGFALDKLRNIEQARELASDITCEVYGSFLKADNIANIDGYVYRIARNVCSQYIGNLQNGRKFISIDEMIPTPEIRDNNSAEMQEILRREIGFLSQRQRLVIYMHYYNKFSVAEISNKLNISQGTVKWHLSDARSKLKEGINMNINEQNTDINPVIFTDMGHYGSPGYKGDTQDMFDSRLKMNIAWTCYHEPKTLPEIARAVGVPQVYVADVLSKLVQYAYIDKLDNTVNPKYRTNMYLVDNRQKFDYGEIYDKAAEFLCEKYLPNVFRNFENDPTHWGLTCDGNDLNFLKYNVVMLALSPLRMFENDMNKLLVKRPDGGNFIATAMVNDDLSIKDQKANIYWTCGFMTRTWQDNYDLTDDESDEIFFENVSADCRYSDRKGGWRDNLSEDWTALAKFIKGGKEKISPEEYKRLCDKGYVFDDRVQPVTVKVNLNKGEDIFNLWCRFARERIIVSDELKKFAKHFDDIIFEEDKKHFPKHMHESVKAMTLNTLGSASMIPRIVEKLLEHGELKPLTDIQKKSVFSILFYKAN